VRPVLALVVPLLLAGCASATVVENTPDGVVLRWDEEHVSRSAVINQAVDLCGGYGHRARRAIAITDDANGTVHTTRFACRALPNIPGTPGAGQ
jgi:hypothetical protein